jgi:hypothetical protein
MRGTLAVAGTGIAAALCCLAIPVTVGIIGISDIAAFGINLGAVATLAAAGIAAWIMRARSQREAGDSESRDG